MEEWSNTLRSIAPFVIVFLLFPIQRGLYLWVERKWGPDTTERTRDVTRQIESAEPLEDLEPHQVNAVVIAVENVMHRKAGEDRAYQKRLAIAFFVLGVLAAVAVALVIR